MAVKEFTAGTQLIQSGQAMNAMHVIAKGTVKATYPGGEFYLGKGDTIGVFALSFGSSLFSYQALDNVSLASYPCQGAQLLKLLGTPDMANMIVNSMFKQLQEIFDQYELLSFDCDNLYHYLIDSYKDYLAFCSKHSFSARTLPALETLSELALEEDIPRWFSGFYSRLRSITTSQKNHDSNFLEGLLLKTGQDVYEIISVCREMYDYKSEIVNLLMNENQLDLFDLYTGILYKTGANSEDSTSLIASLSTMTIQLESQPSIDKDMYKSRVAEYKERLNSLDDYIEPAEEESEAADSAPELADSLNTILGYAGVSPETADAFRDAVAKYSKLSDKNAADDHARKLRLTITKLFYEVYEKAFMKSLHDASVPRVVKMFFNFGYVDEHLAGMKNAAYLYSVVDKLPTSPEKKVYSIYEWLQAIYLGRKTPSRNEFDTDYVAHLHELKMTGQITAQEETEMQHDRKRQVKFELQSMFPPVNKISFGRISSFCPLFSEHNVLKDLSASLVTTEKVQNAFKQIRNIDFSAYYRDVIYTNPNLGIGKESVSVEILPDIILMPNVGIRGVMWQEIEGRKRTTPSRMMLSIFQMEDLTNILVRLTGEFRWEMCKRVQGARWNDVSDASLTSEYFDYIQFYKKNRDLSADAKDKVRLAMQKAKNSFKEMFIRDYVSWIIYEGSGSPRLNKVARGILFTYCPFAKEVRNKLKSNPLWTDTMNRYDVKQNQKIHHYDNLYQKLKNIGAEIPEEIQRQRAYLDK